jgi:serine/threonine protein kinase
MAEQSKQAKSIFLAAIDEHMPEHWSAFLEQACAGDVFLRAEVEKLLHAQAALGSFHEARRLGLPATLDEPITERPGTLIGPYKLLEKIGEGGFGIVFLAEQEWPIRRKVAVKVLKPGMDTSQVIGRFESERQALALMDHPNIARVLDAGATDSGRPYFVMELVKGVSITEYCDQNRLEPEARLKLFLDVCHAIQHAHHKGVIHRDIKPTNVLVTLHDGGPVVKVIDFGIAKATGQKLTERTLFTTDGQMIGTPAYMSPEQAERSGLDIDTRSDVYALGVLLYELLTGTTPLEDRRLRAAGYAEMQRLIREEEAPRPSLRLSSLGDSATMLAASRGMDVKRLAQLLVGDLDWAVMKALDKDRNRRYDTPMSFAAEIERYLRREPILARPPSTVYIVKKFAQRHRAAVLTGAVVAAALLVGAALATWQALVATRAKRDALASTAAEKEAKELAQAREAETQAVLEFVETRVFSAARPEGRAGGLGREVSLEAAPLTEAERWERAVAGMPAEQQIKAVVRRLKELNPAFDGTVTPTIENGAVTRLHFLTDEVEDISPVRALPGLMTLECPGGERGRLSDLSPLRGMRLTVLECSGTRVADLSTLRGMPLTALHAHETRVSDLSPLQGMPLKVLTIQHTTVTSLAPLKGMALTYLDIAWGRSVSDLTPLKDMPLDYLNLADQPVSDLAPLASLKSLRRLLLDSTSASDLTPLRGLGLEELSIRKIPARDLSPLKELPLRSLRLDYRADREKFVRSFKELERINDRPAADFWKKADGK